MVTIFQRLKEMLTSAPILKIADANEIFVVFIDACKKGIGGVLTQNGHIISYESIKLKNMIKTIPLIIWSLQPSFMP